jgi:hypothetical protein
VIVLGFLLGQSLPSLDRYVDVASVDFNGMAASAGAFSREDRCAAAEVGIDHDVVALGAIEYGVRNQRIGFTVGCDSICFLWLLRAKLLAPK